MPIKYVVRRIKSTITTPKKGKCDERAVPTVYGIITLAFIASDVLACNVDMINGNQRVGEKPTLFLRLTNAIKVWVRHPPYLLGGKVGKERLLYCLILRKLERRLKMDHTYELIRRMNHTDRHAIVMSCKKELRNVLKPFGYTFGYDSYEEEWKIYC